jgi:hypothetical protein
MPIRIIIIPLPKTFPYSPIKQQAKIMPDEERGIGLYKLLKPLGKSESALGSWVSEARERELILWNDLPCSWDLNPFFVFSFRLTKKRAIVKSKNRRKICSSSLVL